jgi:hypothetical protein
MQLLHDFEAAERLPLFICVAAIRRGPGEERRGEEKRTAVRVGLFLIPRYVDDDDTLAPAHQQEELEQAGTLVVQQGFPPVAND